MKHEVHLDNRKMLVRLHHWKRHIRGSFKEQVIRDPLQALLAPGMTWEEVAEKHSLRVPQVQGIIQEYVKSVEYAWLNGNVGGGKLLMDEHRGTILAAHDYNENLARYGSIPNYGQTPRRIEPFYDNESGSPLFSDPVKLDLRAAKVGIEIIGDDLVQIIGTGAVDKHSLGFYLHCWDQTAQTIINLLKKEAVIVPKYLGEYEINPEHLEAMSARNQRSRERIPLFQQ